MGDIAYSWMNSPITVGISLMVEGILLWVIPILVSNFYLNYGWGLLKNIFNVSVVLFAIGILIGFYLSKILLNGDIGKYVIFEKNRIEKFFKIFLFSFPLVVIFSAVLIKYLILVPISSTQIESVIILSILSYGGGICFSIGYNILKKSNNIVG
ncbi:conserved hypothetical protein [Methanocaldococcus sp. FS406-22]|uniref:hypothetical protein n=1 Tax=Methanocaldococcus sp. (strain FS406-22) TaxID=644281 RepID=UPI0001BF47FC|nr:hypothetical protein [Methanocaldococcus sp. FS406-22]ADC70055.1 conserved hypothetical protein [Methanocaldococcus sp. FS406-22]